MGVESITFGDGAGFGDDDYGDDRKRGAESAEVRRGPGAQALPDASWDTVAGKH